MTVQTALKSVDWFGNGFKNERIYFWDIYNFMWNFPFALPKTILSFTLHFVI